MSKGEIAIGAVALFLIVTKKAGATFARSATQVKTGSYSGLLTRVGTDCHIPFPIG